MSGIVIVCPQCRVPFTRRSSSPLTGLPKRRGHYYDIEQADWCSECRMGVRWFPVDEATA